MSNDEKKDELGRRDFLALGASSLLLAGLSACSHGDTSKVELFEDVLSEPPRPKTGTVRLAVVGGNFGRLFLFHKHPNCKVTAVSDLREDRKRNLTKAYNCNNSYSSLEELLEKEKNIDAVALFTEPTNHFKHAKMCLQKGYHVFSAVPACVTLEEASELRSLVESSNLTYMMGETSYYWQSTMLARSIYKKEKYLGEINYAEVTYCHDKENLQELITNKKTRFWNPDGTPSWRWGYPPMLYCTHSLGLYISVTRERISKVSCLGWGSGDHPFVTDNVYNNPFWNMTALMQTNKGHIVRCNELRLGAASGVYGSFTGTKGSYYYPYPDLHSEPIYHKRYPSELSKLSLPEYHKQEYLPPSMRVDTTHANSHGFLSCEFIDAIIAQRSPKVDVYEALAMTVPGIVANESAKKGGEQMDVPQFDRS